MGEGEVALNFPVPNGTWTPSPPLRDVLSTHFIRHVASYLRVSSKGTLNLFYEKVPFSESFLLPSPKPKLSGEVLSSLVSPTCLGKVSSLNW